VLVGERPVEVRALRNAVGRVNERVLQQAVFGARQRQGLPDCGQVLARARTRQRFGRREADGRFGVTEQPGHIARPTL
jgi:hypothetical protein